MAMWRIVPGKAVGPFRLGAARADVEAAAGPPLRERLGPDPGVWMRYDAHVLLLQDGRVQFVLNEDGIPIGDGPVRRGASHRKVLKVMGPARREGLVGERITFLDYAGCELMLTGTPGPWAG